jgi:hypothetical protein
MTTFFSLLIPYLGFGSGYLLLRRVDKLLIQNLEQSMSYFLFLLNHCWVLGLGYLVLSKLRQLFYLES